MAGTSDGHAFKCGRLGRKVFLVITVPELKDAQSMAPQSLNSLRELSTLHNAYHKFGLDILAFPCDQLGSQATGGSGRKTRDTSDFCEKMGIDYRIADKVQVNGADAHPVFKLLKQHGPDIRGNFQTSFLIVCNEDRCTIHRFDKLQPRALGWRIEELLNFSDESFLLSNAIGA